MTNSRMIKEAWRKAEEYGITVRYGEQREISCDCEAWTMAAVIRTDEDLPEQIAAIEYRRWPQLCKARAWI